MPRAPCRSAASSTTANASSGSVKKPARPIGAAAASRCGTPTRPGPIRRGDTERSPIRSTSRTRSSFPCAEEAARPALSSPIPTAPLSTSERRRPTALAMSAALGDIDLFFFDGPTPAAVLERYTRLVGRPFLPPRWALGYHQSRWSYTPQARVEEVAAEFRRRSLPADGIWLDIDYMDGFRDFTWNPSTFPDPSGLMARLADRGFKVTAILDPGVKSEPGGTVRSLQHRHRRWTFHRRRGRRTRGARSVAGRIGLSRLYQRKHAQVVGRPGRRLLGERTSRRVDRHERAGRLHQGRVSSRCPRRRRRQAHDVRRGEKRLRAAHGPRDVRRVTAGVSRAAAPSSSPAPVSPESSATQPCGPATPRAPGTTWR